jgi:hypothetical protein
VKIVYNADFSSNAFVKYQADGVTGRGTEIENAQDSVTFATVGDNPPTVSLELVFDISGSMALKTITGGSVTRMKALQDAAQFLFNPGATLDSYAIPGDKVGVIFFSDFSIPAIPAAASPFACAGLPTTQPAPPSVSNLHGADDPTNLSRLNGCVQAQAPTRSTSIGAGLLLAKSGFDLDGTNTNKQVLLFSDGAQNTLPNVVFPVVGSVQVVDGGGTVITIPSGIKICPVTVGDLLPLSLDLQQQIANVSCGGRNAHSPSSGQTFQQATIETYFAQSLSAILPTDKLELAGDAIGTVLTGNNKIERFLVSANDVRMTFALSWSDGTDNDRLPIRLKAPDGTIIDLTNRTSFGHNASFTTISFPLRQGGMEVTQKGEWELTIDGSALHGPSSDYHLIVMEDNPTIESDFTINAGEVGTGEPIPIQVKLTDAGAPVLNATVQAQLMGPSHSQGTVLSTTPIPPVTAPGVNEPGPVDKAQTKLDALYGDPANTALFADNGLPTLTLVDSSSTGVYTAFFNDTLNEGHYYFTVRVRATSPTAGEFQRTFWIARFVLSKPDSGKTVFKLISSVRQRNGSALVKLQAIPHDRFGNFLGPGYEKAMQITSTAGTIEKPLEDKLDGSYEITYRLPAVATNPDFTLQITGSTVTTKSLGDLRQTARLAVFLDLGPNFPHGSFGSVFNTGVSLNAGLEYIANPHFSLEGIFGYHHFPSSLGASLNTYQFSANGKAYLSTGTVRPFVNGGVGGYKFSPGSTYFGGNVGGGVLYTVTSRFGLQISYNLHVINTGPATKFSEVQFGVRWVW